MKRKYSFVKKKEQPDQAFVTYKQRCKEALDNKTLDEEEYKKWIGYPDTLSLFIHIEEDRASVLPRLLEEVPRKTEVVFCNEPFLPKVALLVLSGRFMDDEAEIRMKGVLGQWESDVAKTLKTVQPALHIACSTHATIGFAPILVNRSFEVSEECWAMVEAARERVIRLFEESDKDVVCLTLDGTRGRIAAHITELR